MGWKPFVALCIAAALAGCATDGGSGGSAARKGAVFLHVFVADEARSIAPADIKVFIDDRPVIDRNFSLGKSSYDGQYRLELAQGRHTLRASSGRGKTDIRRTFRVKNEHFIELYLTDSGRVRLTPGSKIRIAKFVFKRLKKPSSAPFNPALWMRLPV